MNRKTIGIFCPGDGSGGPWRYVHSVLAAIDLNEFDVKVFCDIEGEYAKRPGIKIVPLTAGLRSAAPIQEIAQKTASVRVTSRRSGFSVLKTPRLWAGYYRSSRRLAKLLRGHSLDLFHTQNTGCEESPISAWLAVIPKVLGTFHVDSTVDLERVRSGWEYRAIEWLSNRCLHKAISVSEQTKKDWMHRTGIPSRRVVTIHNGIDTNAFQRENSKTQARAMLGLPQDSLLIGGLGRLDPVKGFEYLLDAMARLKDRHPRAAVVIAGSGDLLAPLKAKGEMLGISDRVHLIGFQKDVNLVLDACDIFAMPSLCEALPYGLLEAMAHELPVVATTVGGIPEVVVPGETGFLVASKDSASFADKLNELLFSEEMRIRFGRAGRERVVKHFQESEMVKKTIETYREMLKA